MSSTNRFCQVLTCLNSWVPSLEFSRVALKTVQNGVCKTVGGTELPKAVRTVGGTELFSAPNVFPVGCFSIENLWICFGDLPCFQPFDCDRDHADGDDSKGHEDEVFLDPF